MIVDKQHILEIREGTIEYNGEEKIVKSWFIDLIEHFVMDDRSFRRGKVTTIYTAFSEREVESVHGTLEMLYGVATNTQKERSEIEMTEKFATKAKKNSTHWAEQGGHEGSYSQQMNFFWNDVANMYHNDAEQLRKDTYNDWG